MSLVLGFLLVSCWCVLGCSVVVLVLLGKKFLFLFGIFCCGGGGGLFACTTPLGHHGLWHFHKRKMPHIFIATHM